MVASQNDTSSGDATSCWVPYGNRSFFLLNFLAFATAAAVCVIYTVFNLHRPITATAIVCVVTVLCLSLSPSRRTFLCYSLVIMVTVIFLCITAGFGIGDIARSTSNSGTSHSSGGSVSSGTYYSHSHSYLYHPVGYSVYNSNHYYPSGNSIGSSSGHSWRNRNSNSGSKGDSFGAFGSHTFRSKRRLLTTVDDYKAMPLSFSIKFVLLALLAIPLALYVWLFFIGINLWLDKDVDGSPDNSQAANEGVSDEEQHDNCPNSQVNTVNLNVNCGPLPQTGQPICPYTIPLPPAAPGAYQPMYPQPVNPLQPYTVAPGPTPWASPAPGVVPPNGGIPQHPAAAPFYPHPVVTTPGQPPV